LKLLRRQAQSPSSLRAFPFYVAHHHSLRSSFILAGQRPGGWLQRLGLLGSELRAIQDDAAATRFAVANEFALFLHGNRAANGTSNFSGAIWRRTLAARNFSFRISSLFGIQ
jgi:hypothetical protein